MILRDVIPSPALREYVRKHQIIRFVFGTGVVPPSKVYSPRPEHCLVFCLREQQNIGYEGLAPQAYPKCTLSGQHTTVTTRYVACDFWVLQIVLQPSAVFRLTGIPSYELTNTFIDAEAIWGKDIRTAHEQMCNSEDIEEVIIIAESFLEKIIRQSKRNLHSVDKVGSLILNQYQSISIDRLADQICLSPRQFHRKFTERMGIGPKLFDKVVRFEKAFRMKNAYPHLDWLSIAIACGYYDHQHLAKDYKDFTHLSPGDFYKVDTQAPERNFGLRET
ncbi:AraC family transcriptional regulator [Runella rosea]|uniref:AraC family transcriptional regulator n=1 Tax=Runella rosea TaxID=2259595 RepID=A0A344TD00_9BACT|nr:helix-turn-helix domain-containing protein [Runella rosea]AXE16521.1 AraC family transcriptional regulator [Runella rosea]